MGGYYLEILPNREQLARYGLMISDVQDVVAHGTRRRTHHHDGGGPRTIYGRLALPAGFAFRSAGDREGCSGIAAERWNGASRRIADIRLTQGATSIRTENAKLATYVYVDIRDRDLGGYVAEAKKAIADNVQLPTGTYLVLEWPVRIP